MVKCRVVRLLAAVLPTLGLLVVLLQPPDGEALLVGRVGQAPEAPTLALDDVPTCTYRKGQKHITRSPGMYPGILTARNGTLELFSIPIGKIIISIRGRVSVTRSLRLLLGPLGLDSCTVGLKVRRVIRGRRLVSRPAVVAAIPAVVPTRLVAIATIATGRLGHRGRWECRLLDSHRSRLKRQVRPVLQSFLSKIIKQSNSDS